MGRAAGGGYAEFSPCSGWRPNDGCILWDDGVEILPDVLLKSGCRVGAIAPQAERFGLDCFEERFDGIAHHV
jgi:hypothetical protein